MILQKIKVSVQTSTKVRFITAIPVTITIRESLPLIFKAYQSVVRQNFDEEQAKELLGSNRITSITKNGFLLPLAEEVIHVLNDGDHLFINLGRHEKKEHQSKKERLESKKEEKLLEKIRDRPAEESKTAKEQEKKQSKALTEKQQRPVQQKKEIKKQEQKKCQVNAIPQRDFAKLLSMVKATNAPQPQKVQQKPKKVIVQTPSQSSDSD